MMFDTPFGDIPRKTKAITSHHAGTRTDVVIVELMMYSENLKSFTVRYLTNKNWSYYVIPKKLTLINPESHPEFFI